jgi:hypothetical protein
VTWFPPLPARTASENADGSAAIDLTPPPQAGEGREGVGPAEGLFVTARQSAGRNIGPARASVEFLRDAGIVGE